MPALQVREMPDDLYACLKNSAQLNHRSISQETVSVLESKLMLKAHDDFVFEAESQKRESRICNRKRAFDELDKVNFNRAQLISKQINHICDVGKQELDLRFDVSNFQIEEVQ